MLMTPMTRIAFQANFSQVLVLHTGQRKAAHDSAAGRREQVHKAVAAAADLHHHFRAEAQLLGKRAHDGIEAEAMPEEDGMRKLSTM